MHQVCGAKNATKNTKTLNIVVSTLGLACPRPLGEGQPQGEEKYILCAKISKMRNVGPKYPCFGAEWPQNKGAWGANCAPKCKYVLKALGTCPVKWDKWPKPNDEEMCI